MHETTVNMCLLYRNGIWSLQAEFEWSSHSPDITFFSGILTSSSGKLLKEKCSIRSLASFASYSKLFKQTHSFSFLNILQLAPINVQTEIDSH